MVYLGYNSHLMNPYRANATVVDTVPPELLHMVPEHWYRFPPMNPLWHSLIGVAMIFLGIISITGNCMVLYLMSSVKSLRSPTNLLVCSLACGDLLMMTTNMPAMAINAFAEAWVLGPLLCDLYGMVGAIAGNASIWSLVFISRDRYKVITKGVSAAPLTTKKALLQIMFIWTYATMWAVFPFFGWNRYVLEGNMTSCTIDYFTKDLIQASYVFFYAIFVYFIPLLIILYSYFFIVRAVATHERSLREQARKMNVTSLRANVDTAKSSAEMRLAKIACITVGLWFMAWTPYLIIAWTGIFTNGDKLTPLATIWGAIFAKSAACYNPIVYAISHPKYKAALFKKFPSLACAADVEPMADTKSEMSVATAVSDTKTTEA